MKKQAHKKAHASLYGAHAVREAWLNPERNVRALYMTKQAADSFSAAISQTKKSGLRRPEPTIIHDKHQIDKMLPKGAVHQGLALDTAPLPDTFIQDFIIKSKSQDKTLLLMLDQVTDPHNVGAIIRSASAFGADGMIMQKKHAPDLTGVLAKTACGGVEHIPVAFETNLSRSIETLQQEGFFVYGLDETGHREIGEIDSSGKVVLVLGAEGDGLRKLVKEHCDELVKLPTQGPIASLNVSNAAAVALYATSSK